MSGENSSKLYEMLKDQKAPEVGNKPIFAKDIEYARMLVGGGAKANLGQLFGKKTDNPDECVMPLNYGSKSSMTYNSGALLPEETRLRLFELKKAYSNVEIQACYKGKTKHPSKDLMMSVPAWKAFEPMAKAFATVDWGEWIDTVQSRFFFEEYEIPMILADKFDSMPMTSPLVRVPGALGLLEGELELDSGTFTEQSNTESSYIVEAKDNVVHVKITQDLLDDSSPPLIDKLRREVVKGVARSYERATLDGKAGTGLDADTIAGSAKLYSKAWDGLRQRAFANEVATGSGEEIVFDHAGDSPSKDMFSGLLRRMKCQGADKNDLVYILGCSVAHDLVSGSIPELFTAFAFGGLASNVTGAVPPVFGIEGVESAYVREDLEATGLAANPAAGTLTYCMLVQKSRFMNHIRQATRVWASPSLPSSDHMLMSGKARHAFAGVPQSATERSVTMAINVKTV